MNRKLWFLYGKWIKRLLIASLLYIPLLPTMGGSSLLWSYSIDSISALSVSENGDFIAVGCLDGWYYVFDTWGNLLGVGSVPSSVTSLDMAKTGDLLIGSALGYTFCTHDGAQISSFRSSPVRSVSISSEGISSLVCSKENIFINLGNSMIYQRQVPSDFPVGAMSSNGSLACAASGKSLHIFRNGLLEEPYELDENGEYLFVSKNGEMIVFSTNSGKLGYINTENMELQLKDMGSAILSMASCSTGETVLISTANKLVWLKKGSIVNELLADGGVKILTLSEDGSLAVLEKEGGIIQIIGIDGTLMLTYDLGSQIVSSEISGRSLLAVCTTNSIHVFDLFPQTKSNTKSDPIPSRKSLPLTSCLKESWSIPLGGDASFFTADVDDDGFIEIVLREESVLRLIDGDGNQESSKDIEETIIVFPPLDVDGDANPEIPLTFNSTGFFLLVYDWKKGFTKTYDLESLRGDVDSREGMIIPFAALDIDNDDETEILASVTMGYSCRPRGIVSIDYISGEIEWFYQMGPSAHPDVVEDINGDGSVEIILGSVAPCNCGDDEQFPDCEIYVTALSNAGEELWKVFLGTGYRRVEILAEDVNEHEGMEIIGFGYEASENWGKLFILNCFGEYLYSSEVEYSIFPGAVGDIDSDHRKDIVTVDSRGHVSIFTPDLREKSKKLIKENISGRSQVYLNDINGDGSYEILLEVDKELLILDKNLEVLWNKNFENGIKFLVANFSRCKNTILVLSDKLYAFSYQDTGDSPCPLWVITERNLFENATDYLNNAESSFASGDYRISKTYFERALDIFSQLENQGMMDSISEKMTELSEIIFKLNIWIGIILLTMLGVFSCVFIFYYWITRRRWYRLVEGTLLSNLPVLLGLFQVYHANEEYILVFIRYFIPFIIFSSVIFLRRNILGFLRTLLASLSGHKNMLVLSIMKQSNELYRVSVESIEERFNPVKESKEILFPLETRMEVIKKVDFMMGTLSRYSSKTVKRSLSYVEEILRDTGTIIYRNFIPEDFSNILDAKFLLIEVEDAEIPWELMYSDNFFASKYGISRRIVSTEAVKVRLRRDAGRRALVISDPTERLPGAKRECEIVYRRLKQKMETTLIEGSNANLQRMANLIGQGFDIIHFAGHVDNGLILFDGVMTPQEVREFIVGTPVVFVNGCKSEDLARAFLLGGAMAYVGTIHPIHDESAAMIAADFYDLCLQHQIGEALRRVRESHIDKDLVWASLIMYGDPTLKLL